ncbi:hypothetical protein [Qipengyuania soli]|uniref:Lipoprotein n=1 Tax=Qipengyuania soli TaxID=2782568 RepID=A0A7S8F2J6_9SPHN|nr:hypothetical protein [Qipengyuania soli]QPC99320.1 hypothetical protein IRL76_01720 [Qipengyuania soli]
MRNFILAGLAIAGLAACGTQTETDVSDGAATATPAIASAQGPEAGGTDDVEPAYGQGDALVSGTDYNATTILKCGFDNKPPTQDCNAGIKRNWGKEGEHLVEVEKPDGRKRAIFFKGTDPYGADSAQADGSAGWDFKSTRKDDQVTVRFGPETYVIVDAMITGG